MKYKDKLMEEKIDSMNQNDRIELYSLSTYSQSWMDSRMMVLLISFTSAHIFLILGVLFILLIRNIFIILGGVSIFLYLTFIVICFISIYAVEKHKKDIEETVYKILDRGTNKK